MSVHRDAGEQSTDRMALFKNADDIDQVAVRDGWASDHRGELSITVDHGRQPRRPKRPTKVVYLRDPKNTYRPADDFFSSTLYEAEDDSRLLTKEWKIASLLRTTAKDHATRLIQYRDDAIPARIELEAVPIAEWIAKDLPDDAKARVLDTFREVLRDAIALHRKKRRVTKT